MNFSISLLSLLEVDGEQEQFELQNLNSELKVALTKGNVEDLKELQGLLVEFNSRFKEDSNSSKVEVKRYIEVLLHLRYTCMSKE